MTKKKPAKPAGRKFSNKAIFESLADELPFLGNARAVVIACTCANTAPGNLGRTLQQLGVQGGPFQRCVTNGVQTTGYAIAMDAVPNAPDDRLIAVVNVIQNAPRTA